MAISKKDIIIYLKRIYPKSTPQELYRKINDTINKYKLQRSHDLKAWDKELPKDWYQKQDHIFYVLYTDLFAGSEKKGRKIKGLTKRLYYLKDLGVTNVHILPCLKSSGDAGFAVDDYRKIDPTLGTMNDFEEFSYEAHRKGIKVTLDLVLNHTSDSHKWAKKLKEGDKKFRDYFIIDKTNTGKSWPKVCDVFPEFAPGHWDYVPDIDEYVWATFYSKYPEKGKKYNDFAQWDLNYENFDVLIGMIENILFLANKGVDVFRFDAIPHMWKVKGTDCYSLSYVYDIVDIFYYVLHKVAPRSEILVEACVPKKELLKYFGKGESTHLAYNFILASSLWDSLMRKDVVLLKKAMKLFKLLPKRCTFLNFDVNHDEVNFTHIRNLSSKENAENNLKKMFNHYTKDKKGVPFRFREGVDKYGSTVSGTKWSLLGGDLPSSKEDFVIRKIMLLNAFKLTISGVPMFYQGEELGLSNDFSYLKKKNKKGDSRFIKRIKITDGIRGEVNKNGTKQYKIFNQLKKLISIRKKHEAFKASNIKYIYSKDKSIVKVGNRKFLAIFNFSNKSEDVVLRSDFKDLINNRKVQKGEIEIDAYKFKWLYKC